MKRIVLVFASISLLVCLTGCGSKRILNNESDVESNNSTSSDVMSTQNVTTPESLNENNINIKYENDIAYFDITANDFVKKYNATLTNDAEYMAKSLSSPRYVQEGKGLQQTTIDQYNVSNSAGTAVYTYVHTDKNEKILEVNVGIKKILGKIDIDLNNLLYNDLGDIAMILSGCSQSEWENLVDDLVNKIQNRETPLCCYSNGVVIDTYSNEQAMYFRISCMTKEKYTGLMN